MTYPSAVALAREWDGSGERGLAEVVDLFENTVPEYLVDRVVHRPRTGEFVFEIADAAAQASNLSDKSRVAADANVTE